MSREYSQGYDTPEKRARKKAYALKNREKILARLKVYSKKHYLANREKRGLQIRAWRKKNPQAYRAINRKLNKKKYRENPSARLAMLVRSRFTMALKRTGAKKQHKSLDLIGCSVSELKLHIQSLFKPGMAWNNHGMQGWHIDHIKPCASFDLTDPEQQKACFHFTNLQPLWAEENRAKKDSLNFKQ